MSETKTRQENSMCCCRMFKFRACFVTGVYEVLRNHPDIVRC